MTDVVIARPSYVRRVWPALSLSFRAQWIFWVVPALYLASNWLMLRSLPHHGTAPIYELLMALLTFSLPVGLIVMVLLRLFQYVAIEKPVSPVMAFAREVRDLIVHPARLINGLPIFAAMIFFNKAMVELKPAIPAIKPFDWDVRLMELDRVLHFGVDPWRLLQPFMGFDIITFAVNMAYNFWFVALFGAWFWFGFRKETSELRTRFFLAYMVIWWVGGGLLAVLFSSAGPVYYSDIGLSPDPFAPLMKYLHDVDSRIPIWCLKTQQLLWDGYTGETAALGISAFPSMHNASATLFALATLRVSKPIGIFFIIYAAVILLGSVHLGWHYAVDGYAGIILGLAGWWVAGPITRWTHGLASARRYEEALAAL
jgi:hypothetical protein